MSKIIHIFIHNYFLFIVKFLEKLIMKRKAILVTPNERSTYFVIENNLKVFRFQGPFNKKLLNLFPDKISALAIVDRIIEILSPNMDLEKSNPYFINLENNFEIKETKILYKSSLKYVPAFKTIKEATSAVKKLKKCFSDEITSEEIKKIKERQQNCKDEIQNIINKELDKLKHLINTLEITDDTINNCLRNVHFLQSITSYFTYFFNRKEVHSPRILPPVNSVEYDKLIRKIEKLTELL